MPDKVTITDDKLFIETTEGKKVERPVSLLSDLYYYDSNKLALPDGVKFVKARDNRLVVVHQQKPCVRQLLWPRNEALHSLHDAIKIKVSLPYVITFASMYHDSRGYILRDACEMFFSNTSITNEDALLDYPALLNIYNVSSYEGVWVCTESLKKRFVAHWPELLDDLIMHIWNAPFNTAALYRTFYSSAYKEGKGFTAALWAEHTAKDNAFGLKHSWEPSGRTVGQTIGGVLDRIRYSYNDEGCKPSIRENILKRIVKLAKV